LALFKSKSCTAYDNRYSWPIERGLCKGADCINQELIEWTDEQVKKGGFSNRSAAIEHAITKLKGSEGKQPEEK